MVTCNVFLAWQLWKTSNALSDQTELLHSIAPKAVGAIMFANGLADRGIHIPCDDCGNEMSTDDSIDVLPNPNTGQIYIGHASHNRRNDWGLAN